VKDFKKLILFSYRAKLALVLFLCCSSIAAVLSIPNVFAPGDSLSASKITENFNALYTEINARDARISALESEMGSLLVLYLDDVNPLNLATLSRLQFTAHSNLDLIRADYATVTDVQTITINQAGTYRVEFTAFQCGAGGYGTAQMIVTRSGANVYGRTYYPVSQDCGDYIATFLWTGFQAGDQVKLSANAHNGAVWSTPLGAGGSDYVGQLYVYREF